MTVERAGKTTIKLNVLGPLEARKEPGGEAALPASARVRYLLALIAIKDTYEKRELVGILWPADKIIYSDPDCRESIDERLNQELSKARQPLDLGDAASDFLGSRTRVVARSKNGRFNVTSDFDDFHELAGSADSADWRAALALVRGELAAGMPEPADIDPEWLKRQREHLRKDITKILQRLHANATADELDDLCHDVLDGRYQRDHPLDPRRSTPPPSAQPQAPQTSPDQPAEGHISDTDDKASSRPPATKPRPTKRRRIVALLVTFSLLAAGVGLILRAPIHTASLSIPPASAIVNTWTGHWSTHAPTATIEYAKGQIEGGEDTLRACDISTGAPCAYLAKERTINARPGDIIEIKYHLYDSDAEPIPYVKLDLTWGPGNDEVREIGVGMLAAWPVAPHGVEYPAGSGGDVSIRMAAPGPYHLVYIPGSTTLTSPDNSKLLYHLPNGIMNGGIGLEDVGSPSYCFQCADEYARIVSFRAKVTSASPTLSNPASIPPAGAIVNTWTGKWSLHIPTTRARLAQIDGGNNTFHACDLTIGRPCQYRPKEDSINARMGDTIEFKDFLYDPQNEPLPYVKLDAYSGPGGPGKQAAKELTMQVFVGWPGGVHGPSAAGNTTDFTIHLPKPGDYHLTYVPGSTTLTSPYNPKLLFHLPNGIMEEGIGLEDFGSPSTCFECALAYSRYVNFQSKIT